MDKSYNRKRLVNESLRARELGTEWQKALREGVPEIGWDGDPWLTLAYNQIEHKFEVWDEKPAENSPVIVAGWPADQGPESVLALCSILRDYSLKHRTAADVVKEVIDHNDAIKAELDKQQKEATRESAERVAHGLRSVLGEPRAFFSMVE